MKPTTSKWIDYADGDMEVAEKLCTEGEKMSHGYQIAVFHCHQAVEKMLKAVLCEQEKEIIKIHHLVHLLGLTELTAPQHIAEYIADLNPHYSPIRYPALEFRPNFAFTYNRPNTQIILDQATHTILWLKKQIPQSTQ